MNFAGHDSACACYLFILADAARIQLEIIMPAKANTLTEGSVPRLAVGFGQAQPLTASQVNVALCVFSQT